MAGSVNKVIIVGNLGRDPEIRALPSGGKVCNLSVATSESWTDKQTGERKERTEWVRVTIFNEKLADIAERFLAKGRKVYIEGALETRKYTDNSGVEKYTTEVVLRNFRGELTLLDSAKNGEAAEERPAPAPASKRVAGGNAQSKAQYDDLNDEVPF